jgi:hypothetical protein
MTGTQHGAAGLSERSEPPIYWMFRDCSDCCAWIYSGDLAWTDDCPRCALCAPHVVVDMNEMLVEDNAPGGALSSNEPAQRDAFL